MNSFNIKQESLYHLVTAYADITRKIRIIFVELQFEQMLSI